MYYSVALWQACLCDIFKDLLKIFYLFSTKLIPTYLCNFLPLQIHTNLAQGALSVSLNFFLSDFIHNIICYNTKCSLLSFPIFMYFHSIIYFVSLTVYNLGIPMPYKNSFFYFALPPFNMPFTFFSFSELSFFMHTQKEWSFLMLVFVPTPRRPLYYKVSPHIGQNVFFPKKYNTFNRV
jgi:hypothetical protein